MILEIGIIAGASEICVGSTKVDSWLRDIRRETGRDVGMSEKPHLDAGRSPFHRIHASTIRVELGTVALRVGVLDTAACAAPCA